MRNSSARISARHVTLIYRIGNVESGTIRQVKYFKTKPSATAASALKPAIHEHTTMSLLHLAVYTFISYTMQNFIHQAFLFQFF